MAKKTASKKTAKKAVRKAATAKKAVKKAPAKTGPGDKTPAADTGSAAPRVAAPRKKTAVKKAPAKVGPTDKTPPAAARKRETSVTARVDVGFGNNLHIRGDGAGLSWDRGVLMENVSPYEWVWKADAAASDVEFKFLINDEVWAEGENQVVSPGGASISTPVFPR